MNYNIDLRFLLNKRCPNLTSLSITDEYLNEKCVVEAFKNMKNLRILKIKEIYYESVKLAFGFIKDRLLPRLEYFELTTSVVNQIQRVI